MIPKRIVINIEHAEDDAVPLDTIVTELRTILENAGYEFHLGVLNIEGGNWRPVSEKPTEVVECLTYTPGAGIQGATFMGQAWHEYSDKTGWRKVHNVTHWRPLPEPPQEAEDGNG